MIEYIVIYLIVTNLLGWGMMRSDKKRAIKGQYRIPEKRLFMIALLGGSIGTTMGMYQYRHKTKHWYFKWGMPLILILQVLFVGYLLFSNIFSI